MFKGPNQGASPLHPSRSFMLLPPQLQRTSHPPIPHSIRGIGPYANHFNSRGEMVRLASRPAVSMVPPLHVCAFSFLSLPLPSFIFFLSTAVHVLTNQIDLRSDTTMQDTRVQHSLTPPIPLPQMTMQPLPTSSTSVRATTSACAIADAAPTTSPATPFEIDRRG